MIEYSKGTDLVVNSMMDQGYKFECGHSGDQYVLLITE